MSSQLPTILGIDLGGTNIEAAVVRDGKILASKKKKTRASKGADAVLGRIVETAEKALDQVEDRKAVEGVCIGAPGVIDPSSGMVMRAPNLDWQNVPLGEELQKRLGLPVVVDNDVNIGVLGEYVYGAGRGSLHMVGVFVGTGIGGGIVINGHSHYGSRGAAGEIGHTIVRARGRKCSCGREGCVEAYSSKTSMEKMIRHQIQRGRKSSVLAIMKDKGKEKLSSSVVEAALEDKDGLMEETLKVAQFHLGLLAANLVNTLDPEVIVFGGGLVERLGQGFVDPIANVATRYYIRQSGAEKVRLLAGELGDDAGPVGAAVVAQRRIGSA